ncbi:uncharacterized protein SPAPADRAFT_157951 [Spathaspora passalidarum NRRL Y-27907]|uniref:Uncharacterized protein n=1 Tax=Spathaspora passalidarum (strain NRRL Y-27907 / 11-Y1) TaxID=619300 RepID=G3AUZ6_SPAPN|nr:uncharacterized protein SPAPADRAFT_157951 [Spathaspora passalidarum NRRL Y-27907]EGW29852.1 hypothetical protein SPAPADRAFT_157951 [Spathaspora passalidarum NRRL Y-27907]
MSGSFWKFTNGFTSLSNISTLLENHATSQDEKPNVSESYTVLLKLLDENDLLQELLSNNPMLLEFLRNDVIVGMLVDLVINEGVIDAPEDTDLISKETADTTTSEASTGKEESEKESEKESDKESEKSDEAETETDAETDKESESEKSEESDSESESEDLNEETPEDRANRRATIASEILSADVWSLTDTVMESTANLNSLWSILDTKEPLSINVSTYFMKIMEHLLDMKCDDMISYLIENQPNLVEKFINHLSNPPLMDFLLKLISTDKPDNATGIIEYLQSQNLITHLINSLDIDPNIDPEQVIINQSSAGDFLKALITISANSTTDNSTIGPNELTRELVSPEQMQRLCDIMLKGGYALANGVGIIIEIIRKNNSDYDILPILYISLESHPPTGRDPIYLGHLLRVFGEQIPQFNKLLIKDYSNLKLKTPFGEIEPLGFERFKICELIAELLHCSNMALLNDNRGFDIVSRRDAVRNKMKEYDPISFKYNEIIVLPDMDPEPEAPVEEDEEAPHANANLSEAELRADPVVGDLVKISVFDTQIISNILSMFFRFPWNNFLHNVVFDIVQQVLNGSMDIGFNKFLAIDLFVNGDIINKITEGQKLCQDYELTHNGLRLGFMGHLTLIAEEVVKFIQLYPGDSLSVLINEKIDNEVWESYVNNVLYDTREKYNAILGGGDEESEPEDEPEGDTSIDEGLNEIIEEVKTGLGFDGEPQLKKKHLLETEESESDDDDHFSNYMSQQLTSPAAQPDEFTSSEEEEEIVPDDDDDDYIDPNDDGLSYKKPNPLYDASGSLKSGPVTLREQVGFNDEDEDEFSSSSSSSSDEEEEEEQETQLTRAASQG